MTARKPTRAKEDLTGYCVTCGAPFCRAGFVQPRIAQTLEGASTAKTSTEATPTKAAVRQRKDADAVMDADFEAAMASDD